MQVTELLRVSLVHIQSTHAVFFWLLGQILWCVFLVPSTKAWTPDLTSVGLWLSAPLKARGQGSRGAQTKVAEAKHWAHQSSSAVRVPDCVDSHAGLSYGSLSLLNLCSWCLLTKLFSIHIAVLPEPASLQKHLTLVGHLCCSLSPTVMWNFLTANYSFGRLKLKELSITGAVNCRGTMHTGEQSVLQKGVLPKCSLAAFNQNV